MLIARRGSIASALDTAVGPQSAVPTATLAAALWTIGGGSPTTHAALADENDSTFIQNAELSEDVGRWTMGALVDPGDGTGHAIRVRAKTSDGGSGVLRLALYEGANARKALTSVGALTTSFAAYEITLSEAEANAITDYSALEVRMGAASSALQNIQVARLRLDID